MKKIKENNFQKLKKELNKCRKDFYKIKMNIFDIFNMKYYEIRHSRMLAFLFNPNAIHKRSKFLKNLYQYIKLNKCNIQKEKIEVICEKENNIDVAIFDHYNKFVIIIENKIKSKRREGQLEKYSQGIKENYKNYEKKCIYLCKNYEEGIDDEWKCITYQDLFNEILFKDNKKISKNEYINYLIKDYEKIFRGEFNMDSKEKKKCLEIYDEYKQELDMIYNYASKSDKLEEPNYIKIIKKVFKDYKKNGIIYDRSKQNAKIAFFTERLNNYFSTSKKTKNEKWGAWGKGTAYFYWFHLKNDESDLELVFELGYVRNNNKEDSLSSDKKLIKKIEKSFQKIRECFTSAEGLKQKNGITKKGIGQFNQMYSYVIKDFNDYSEKDLEEKIRYGIDKIIKFENKWVKD